MSHSFSTKLSSRVGARQFLGYTKPVVAPALLGLLSSVACAPAFAQDSADKSFQLEEIVITAQRREEDLQRTPVAITVFSGKDLAERNVRNISDLVTSTPNLEVTSLTPSSGTGSAVFFLRGLGQQRGGNGTQPAVGIYIDDFYYPSLSGSLLRVMDISQLEVLRGPQGTLFGRNTIGGAIRYTSAQPSQEFGGHAELTVGDYARRDITGTLNVPVTSSFALRFGGASLTQDGFITNQNTGKSVGDTRDSVARLQARFSPNEQWTADLTAERVVNDLRGYAYVVPSLYTGPGSIAFLWNNFIGPAATRSPSLPSYGNQYVSSCEYCQYGDTNEFVHNQTTDYRTTIAWSPSDHFKIKSLTGYFKVLSTAGGGLDRSPLPILDSTSSSKTTSWSQEFQFTGTAFEADRLNWTAGLYAFDSKFLDNRTSVSFGGPVAPSISDYENKATAAYAQLTFAITDKLSVTAGGRYSKEKYITNPAATVTFPPPQHLVFGHATADDSNVSPMAKIQYQWTPTLMTYGSVTKGFRGGGINQINTSLPNNGLNHFEPETMISYEGGIRTQFLDNHLQLNATYFDAKYEKIQTTRPINIPTPPFVVTLIENAGSGATKGFEFEARAVMHRLQLHATLATLDTHYDSVGSSTAINLSSKFARSPKLSYSLGGTFEQPLPQGTLRFSADYGWQGTQKSTPAQVPDASLPPGSPAEAQDLPSYGLVSARATYVFADELWSVALAGTNLLNKYYYTGGANFATIAPNYYEPGAPRQLTLSVQRKF